MVQDERDGALLTLEPLLEAVREGVEAAEWTLSGLQKTTSHRFEGRWEGESTRSAYLFFHRDDLPDPVSVDVYLDETSRGLKGNLALVLDAPKLGELGPVRDVMARLGRAGTRILPEGYRRPLTLRFRLRETEQPADDAESEVRFKVHLPSTAIDSGPSAVSALAESIVSSFEELLADHEIRNLDPRS